MTEKTKNVLMYACIDKIEIEVIRVKWLTVENTMNELSYAGSQGAILNAYK